MTLVSDGKAKLADDFLYLVAACQCYDVRLMIEFDPKATPGKKWFINAIGEPVLIERGNISEVLAEACKQLESVLGDSRQ